MTDIALTAAQIAAVHPEEAEIYSFIAGEAITKGQLVYMDSAGKVQVADANDSGHQQAIGIAMDAAPAALETLSVLKRGAVAGFTLTNQAFDDGIYLSDTAGVAADSNGTLTVPIGRITSIPEVGGITKVIYFDFRWRADHA